MRVRCLPVQYVYTAEAPTKVLSVFSELVAANGTTGKLPTAVKQLMGNTTLKGVTCTGEGPGGSLAVLCGVSSALLFPTAAVDVITFDAAWVRRFFDFDFDFDHL